MRFFQSESHSKPDDTTNDDTVPAPRTSEENDTPGDRGPDAADSPHYSIGRDDTDAAPDRSHLSTGLDSDADRDGRVDDAEPRTDEDDSSVRTADPVDADVVPDKPVDVEPAPQETAFGAATVGGAVAASENAAHRDDEDTTAVGTAAVPESSDGFGDKPLRAEAVEGFGPAGTDSDTVVAGTDPFVTDTHTDSTDSDAVVADPDLVTTDSGVDSDSGVDPDSAEADKPFRAEDEGETVEAGQPAAGGTVEGFGPAHRAEDDAEGFGTAENTEGFGAAEPVDEDKPLRAEDDDDSAEGEPVRTDVDETTALGVAAGAAAGAAVAGAATKDRDRDGHPDSERVAIDGEPLTPATTAAVPIEPVPASVSADETPATTDEPVELLPGDVPEQPALAAFFREDTATDFRARWREVQLRFVDDPAQAASDAGTLIEEVVTALNTAVTEQRAALGGTTSGEGDTEQLRVLVRRQRDFLDRILGL